MLRDYNNIEFGEHESTEFEFDPNLIGIRIFYGSWKLNVVQ